MEIPEQFKGMKLVKDYPKQKFARYTNGKWCECFTYHELGHRTAQIKDKEINVSNHF